MQIKIIEQIELEKKRSEYVSKSFEEGDGSLKESEVNLVNKPEYKIQTNTKKDATTIVELPEE